MDRVLKKTPSNITLCVSSITTNTRVSSVQFRLRGRNIMDFELRVAMHDRYYSICTNKCVHCTLRTRELYSSMWHY
jgi:hypothetical protein